MFFSELFKDQPTWEETFAEIDRRRGVVPARNLHDDLARDLDTFLNLGEFAEIITLNGVTLKAIVTASTADIPRAHSSFGNDRQRLRSSAPPLIGEHVTINFKTADYLRERERLPKNSESCRVNGDLFHVISSTAEYGLATLVLRAERMNQPLTTPRLPALYDD